MNNFKLSAILSQLKVAEEELFLVKEALSSMNEEQQIEFFNYCKKWKLAPWMHTQMKRHGLNSILVDIVREQFSKMHQQVETANEARNQESLRFLKEFKKRGVDVIVLKGNLFIHTVYKDVGYKRMNDFDMLIHQKDWPIVQEIYFQLGYIPLGFGWSGEKQEAAKFSHTGMSFISPNYKCITGTQWGLKSPTSKYTLDIEDVWATAKEFDFYGEKVKQLSPEYNVLHLLLHMGIYKCGTRDCMDIYNLFLSGYQIDDDKLVEIIKQSNAIDKAWFTFNLSNLCSKSIPQDLIERIKPSKNSFLTRRLAKRLQLAEKTGDFHNSYNDYFHHIEMCVFYFNLFPEFHKRLSLYSKLIWLIKWPKMRMALKLADLPQNATFRQKVKARIKAPYFVLALTAEEIGWGITFMLLIKFFFDTLLSIKNYFVKKDSYFKYLKKKGINPEDIKREVGKIQ